MTDTAANLPRRQASNPHPTLLVIVGSTSSGKSELAVRLAKKYNGEIISCDSRQIYKGMNLGTGKVDGQWKAGRFIYKRIPHYCIDYINPGSQYSVSVFQHDAIKSIDDILNRGKLPVLCGGTGHWIDAVAFNQTLPDVKPNPALRNKLERLSTKELFARIVTKDPARAKTIDPHNRRRLIRALEIVITTGKPVPTLPHVKGQKSKVYDALWLGIKTEQNSLYQKIDRRLKQRLKSGMVKEVKRLHKQGLSFKRLESFGLEYKYVSLYLQKKLSFDEMLRQLSYAIKHYSKRQLTWWKRNKDICWIANPAKAESLIEKFLE